MNTKKSDKIATHWNKQTNPLKRASLTLTRTFNTTPEKFFPLLCPTTEYDWLPGWNCELLHSNSGYSEQNVVFRTNFFGPEEIWVCTRFEPNKIIEYARTSDIFCAKMEIHIMDNLDGTVTGHWVVIVSALNENGNMVVEGLGAARIHLEKCLEALDHYINTGELMA